MAKAKTGRPKPGAAAPASKPAPPAGMAGSPPARPWRRPERVATRSGHWRALLRRGTRKPASAAAGGCAMRCADGLAQAGSGAGIRRAGGLARCRISAPAPGEIARLPRGPGPGLPRPAGRPARRTAAGAATHRPGRWAFRTRLRTGRRAAERRARARRSMEYATAWVDRARNGGTGDWALVSRRRSDVAGCSAAIDAHRVARSQYLAYRQAMQRRAAVRWPAQTDR